MVLYDLQADPLEQVNLWGMGTDEQARLQPLFDAWQARSARCGEGVLQVDEELRQALRERGYWSMVAPSQPEEQR